MSDVRAFAPLYRFRRSFILIYMSTKLATFDGSNKPQYRYVRDGVAGNFDVTFQMIRLARAAIIDKTFQDIANKILISHNANGYTDAERKLRIIYNWVTTNITYVSDTAGRIESVKSPLRTISDGYGDCDDLAILTAAFIGVIGYEPRFVLAKFKGEKQFSHIYVDVEADGDRYVLDPSLPHPRFNDEVNDAAIVGINLFTDENANSLYGIYKQATYSAKDIYHKSADVLRIAGSKALPLPIFAGVNLGLNLVTSAATKNHSLSEIGADVHRELDQIIWQLQRGEIAFDVAKLSALQIASRLNVGDWEGRNEYAAIKGTIKAKLDWIKDYTENNPQIELNPKGMILLGVGLLAVGAWYYKHNRK